MESFFKLRERGTSVGTEVRAGLTTFMVMAYIIFVNPDIISRQAAEAGGAAPPFLPVVVATALAAGLLTIAMGLLTNYPFALAAGLGLNAVVAFELIVGRGLQWQDAMAVIVWEGILITLLVLTGLREAVMNAIPLNLKRAIAVGIGLFILFIGLVGGGFVVRNPNGPVPPVLPGDVVNVATLTFVIGLAIALALMARRVRGALLLTIILTTIIAIVLNYVVGPANSGFLPFTAVLPERYIFDFSLANFETILQPLKPEHLLGVWTNYNVLIIAMTVFTLMMADFFDTMGTVVGVGEQAGFVDAEGRMPGLRNVLLVDSLGAVAGGAFGVSSNTTYIESAAGVAEGGRTGLTSVVVGILFLVAILFAPIAGIVPSQATAPVLVVVGFLMFTIARDFDWGVAPAVVPGAAAGDEHDRRAPGTTGSVDSRIDVLFPVLVTLIVMPLTFTITEGIAAGFVTYVFLKLVTGRVREVHPLMWLVAAAFVIFFAVPWIETLLAPAG